MVNMKTLKITKINMCPFQQTQDHCERVREFKMEIDRKEKRQRSEIEIIQDNSDENIPIVQLSDDDLDFEDDIVNDVEVITFKKPKRIDAYDLGTNHFQQSWSTVSSIQENLPGISVSIGGSTPSAATATNETSSGSCAAGVPGSSTQSTSVQSSSKIAEKGKRKAVNSNMNKRALNKAAGNGERQRDWWDPQLHTFQMRFIKAYLLKEKLLLVGEHSRKHWPLYP